MEIRPNPDLEITPGILNPTGDDLNPTGDDSATDESKDKLIEVFPQYVYMIIPTEWIKTYYVILINLSEYGLDMVQNCKASCDDKNKKIIDCFNMFFAAISAKQLGKDSEANLLIKYINTQLKVDNNKQLNNIIIPSSSDGTHYVLADIDERKFYKFGCDCEAINNDFLDDLTDDGEINNSNKK